MKLKLAALRRSRTRPAAVGCYRVALHGFGDFERNALSFCLKHAAKREPAYVHVERASDADFIVADASHEALATSVTRGARMRDTLFVGEHAPPGARSHVERPIDPEQILRVLDAMAAEREAPAPLEERPDIVLPMAARESDFPTLSEFDIVTTAPAAFDRSPVLINLADLEPIARPRARGATPPTSATAPDAVTTPAPVSSAEPIPDLMPESPPGPVLEFGNAAGADAPLATASVAPAQPARPEDALPPEHASQTPARRARNPPALAPDDFETIAPVANAEPAANAGPAPAEAPSAAKPQPASAQERAEAKAAARRRSRRARLAQSGRSGAESLSDVLLLGATHTDDGLAAQLEAFGFQVRRATYSADALALLAELALAAVFLDVAPGSDEDMDGLELCMEIKHQRVVLAGPVPPIFLLANRDSAAGRVRAKLAGCDALLIRPVTRGDAARALEACDVALPKDERRIERS